MLRGKRPLKIREGYQAVRHRFVEWPRQPVHRVLAKFVRHVLGEGEFILDDWPAELHPWSHIQKTDQMVVLSPERGNHVQKLVIPSLPGRLNVDSGHAAGKSAVRGAVRRTENLDALNRIDRDGNRETSRHRIH